MQRFISIFNYIIHEIKYHLGILNHLDIELNNTCNHACVMCWHSEPLKFQLKVMKYADAVQLLKDGYKAGLRSVKLNLRGEPTLHKDLAKIVRIAKQIGYKKIAINTHGCFLRDKFDELKEAGITMITVSLGSTDRKKYAEVHQVPETDYDKLHEGLQYIRDNQGLVRIHLNCHFSVLGNFDFDWIKREYPKFKIIKRYIQAREGSDISIKREKIRKKRCPHMHRRLTALSTGGIFPCCMSFNAPEDIRLGNNIEDALKSRKILIKRYKNKDFPVSCHDCPSQDVYKWK